MTLRATATPPGKIAVGPGLRGMVNAAPSRRRYDAGSIARPDHPCMALWGHKSCVSACTMCFWRARMLVKFGWGSREGDFWGNPPLCHSPWRHPFLEGCWWDCARKGGSNQTIRYQNCWYRAKQSALTFSKDCSDMLMGSTSTQGKRGGAFSYPNLLVILWDHSTWEYVEPVLSNRYCVPPWSCD